VEVGGMKAGDTVVISAAAGSVGQIAGQIAKLSGCRVIAITSSEQKLARCRQIGYDDGINYRTEPDLSAAIARVCPDGVDVYFDNTAGPIHDAVMQNLATHARIIVCGTVSLADRFEQPDIGERFLRRVLVSRARIQGFISSDFQHRHQEGWSRLVDWYQQGKLKCEYDIV
ncbi:MAG: NADP-dependent oxidoreductase, partial [Candidatus Poribacteria bacterium]|nr:NADP-dependent oxidoreductase [Candidatus Poribacteria bacterium]